MIGARHPRPGHRIDKRIGRLLKSFAALAGAGGIVVIGLQLIGWFEDGVWTPHSILDLWLFLGNSFSLNAASGTGRAVLWLLDLPLAPSLIVVGLLLLAAGMRIDS